MDWAGQDRFLKEGDSSLVHTLRLWGYGPQWCFNCLTRSFDPQQLTSAGQWLYALTRACWPLTDKWKAAFFDRKSVYRQPDASSLLRRVSCDCKLSEVTFCKISIIFHQLAGSLIHYCQLTNNPVINSRKPGSAHTSLRSQYWLKEMLEAWLKGIWDDKHFSRRFPILNAPQPPHASFFFNAQCFSSIDS